MLRNLVGENRAISFQTIWGSGDLTSFETQAGSFIDYTTVMGINSVWACVSLIADTISSLPVDTYIRRDGIAYPYRPRPTWVKQPDDYHVHRQLLDLESAIVRNLGLLGLTVDARSKLGLAEIKAETKMEQLRKRQAEREQAQVIEIVSE